MRERSVVEDTLVLDGGAGLRRRGQWGWECGEWDSLDIVDYPWQICTISRFGRSRRFASLLVLNPVCFLTVFRTVPWNSQVRLWVFVGRKTYKQAANHRQGSLTLH